MFNRLSALLLVCALFTTACTSTGTAPQMGARDHLEMSCPGCSGGPATPKPIGTLPPAPTPSPTPVPITSTTVSPALTNYYRLGVLVGYAATVSGSEVDYYQTNPTTEVLILTTTTSHIVTLNFLTLHEIVVDNLNNAPTGEQPNIVQCAPGFHQDGTDGNGNPVCVPNGGGGGLPTNPPTGPSTSEPVPVRTTDPQVCAILVGNFEGALLSYEVNTGVTYLLIGASAFADVSTDGAAVGVYAGQAGLVTQWLLSRKQAYDAVSAMNKAGC